MKMKKIVVGLFVLVAVQSFAQSKKKPSTAKSINNKTVVNKTFNTDSLIEITTNFGIMKARLYNSTPLHRDNFLNLVRTGFYDSLLFHRVIAGFMIQGGDPSSKNAKSDAMLGSGEAPNIPMVNAEFKPDLFHKKGALCAARTENPEKKSSNCQFYIVQGRKTDTTQLNPTTNYTADQKEIYARIGGTPFLDQNYTVFGEVYFGLDVIDRIAAAKVGTADRPIENVMMKMKIIR
jgi:cyclophilin family peptidyl-prolyl cis-trans isomerase